MCVNILCGGKLVAVYPLSRLFKLKVSRIHGCIRSQKLHTDTLIIVSIRSTYQLTPLRMRCMPLTPSFMQTWISSNHHQFHNSTAFFSYPGPPLKAAALQKFNPSSFISSIESGISRGVAPLSAVNPPK